MRPSIAERRIHLIDLDEPIVQWHGLTARCGYEFRHAETQYMFGDGLNINYELSAKLWNQTCRQCLQKFPVGDNTRRYVYGLYEGTPQEMERSA